MKLPVKVYVLTSILASGLEVTPYVVMTHAGGFSKCSFRTSMA